jgi:hypothetical protein
MAKIEIDSVSMEELGIKIKQWIRGSVTGTGSKSGKFLYVDERQRSDRLHRNGQRNALQKNRQSTDNPYQKGKGIAVS